MFGEAFDKNMQKDPQFDELNATLPHEPAVHGDNQREHEDVASLAEATAQDTHHVPALDDDIQGVELKEYAKRENISVDSVWRKIRAGALIARTENGFVYVYGSNQPGSTNMQSQPSDNEQIDRVLSDESLPPLPVAYEGDEFGNLPAVRNQNPAVAEVALLLDHLTVAKEESKQVLKLSQESISRITQMSEAIVKAKDELIAQQERVLQAKEEALSSHEQEIAELKLKLQQKENDNRRLRQDVEDLEMLTRTLGGEV